MKTPTNSFLVALAATTFLAGAFGVAVAEQPQPAPPLPATKPLAETVRGDYLVNEELKHRAHILELERQIAHQERLASLAEQRLREDTAEFGREERAASIERLKVELELEKKRAAMMHREDLVTRDEVQALIHNSMMQAVEMQPSHQSQTASAAERAPDKPPLVGVLGETRAMFRLPGGGGTRTVSVNEVVGGYTLKAVHADHAVLRWKDQDILVYLGAR